MWLITYDPDEFLRALRARGRSAGLAGAAAVAVLLAGAAQVQGQAAEIHDEGYLTPPPEVAEVVTAPRHENVNLTNLSPNGQVFLNTLSAGLTQLEDLATPFKRLGGLAMDLNAQRSRGLSTGGNIGVEFISWDDGSRVTVDAPAGSRISGTRWSPDGNQLAFTANFANESHLFVTDVASGETRQLTTTPLLATRVSTVEWSGDGQHVFAVVRPPNQGAPPQDPAAPVSPLIRVTSSDENRLRTYPSLLRDPHEQDLLEYYTTGQLVRINVNGGSEEPVGEPAMIENVSASPGGEHLRMRTTQRPFSYIVPVGNFGDVDEIWDLEGTSLVELERRDVRDGSDSANDDDENGEPEKRSITWRPDGQGLSFLQREPEADRDEGDEEEEREGRNDRADRVMQWLPPFDDESIEVVYESDTEIRSVRYSDDAQVLFLTERNGDTERLYAVFLDDPEEQHTIYEQDTDDWYDNPGSLMSTSNELGASVVRMSPDREHVYLSGTEYFEDPLEEAPRPFVDRVEIRTGETERVFRSAEDMYEQVTAVLDDDLSQLMVRRQAPTTIPDSWLLDVASGDMTRMTENVDHTPDITNARREYLDVTRPDGVTFRVRVTLPQDYQEGQRLPAMLWFYPREYPDQEAYDNSNRTFNKNSFNSVGVRSMETLLRRGYAVIHNDHPIIGSPDSWNNNWTVDLRANLQTVIDEVDARGWIDRRRLGLGGHSYGGFGTINAMVQTPLFRAGIAGAPNSNRLLTPLGFQRERRELWEARETYIEMSPFLWAERLTGALLIYHGEDDQNVGTFPDNSWRLIHGLNGLGKTAALYMYPYEGHGQQAEQTLLDMWARWVAWLDHYVKDADITEPVQPVVVEEQEADGQDR